MSHEEDIDARLSRLSAATAGVRPRADFSRRVMQGIYAEPAGGLLALRSPASRFLPVGMLAAALALVWAVSVNNQVNEAMASSDDTELAW
ncbi:MAG TPA: hypothetical protein VEQ59_23645 [Polyangiaceae bacterium]|nr:hypothetical protein [Polyangiaceae bacterium]